MVEKIKMYRFGFRLEKPFVIALGAIPSVEVAIVVIEDDKGRFGIGEACPSWRITGETIDTAIGSLEVLAPMLLGEDPLRIGYLVERMDSALLGNPSAKAALDIALHDLAGKILGVPVWKLLGGHSPGPVSTDYTVGIDEPERMAQEAARLVEEGFREIKVKVGENPERDLERVRAIRKAVGDGITVRIDANQGWSPQEAVWVLREMEPFRVQLVEQPVPFWDLEGLRYVRERSPIPVMADEAVHSPRDALRAIRAGAVDYINIKLMKAGGLHRAKEIAAISRAAGLANMIGSMVETDIGATAAIHFALSEGNVRFRDLDTGTDPNSLLITDGGSYIEGGMRYLRDPEAPGLGIKGIKEELLEPVAEYRR